MFSSVSHLTASLLLQGQPCGCLADYVRTETAKHQQCLQQQREYYSEAAIAQAEQALMRILEQADCLCQRKDASQVIADLLRKFDAVTNLSAFSDLKNTH